MREDFNTDTLSIRLKHFIDHLGLNSSTFADKCGIPRPSFSQILSGRNQKVSNLLIGKIHDAYPDLSLYWLMFGQGDMLISGPASPFEPEFNPEMHDMDTPVAPYTDVVIATSPSHEEKIPADDEEMQADSILSDRNSGVLLRQILEQQTEMAQTLAEIKVANEDKKSDKPRKVASITIFYDDSSFETFIPGK